MKNILISLGSVIREEGLLDQIKNFNNYIFLIEKKHNRFYKKIKNNKKIYFEICEKKKIENLSPQIINSKIYELTDEILNDQNSFFILSRRKLNIFEYSPMRLNDIAVNLINMSYNILIKKKIDYLIIHNTPHAEDWFLFRTAELLGKKIYIIRESIIPGYSRFFEGLLDQKIIKTSTNQDNYSNKIINEFIEEKNNNNYLISIPGLQNDRKKMFNNKYSGIIPDLKFFLKEDSFTLKRTIKAKLSVIKSSLLKNNALNFYRKNLSIKSIKDLRKYKSYIVFFLQYQPERTSIPEGGLFSYQYKTILFLKSILPKHINLIVKEHPDTYRNKFSPRFKSELSYKNIISIPGVYLCDMNIDPFTLIDNSILVATLTGNVGIESLCRGKRLIFFGNAIYKDYKYALNGFDKNFELKFKEFLNKKDKIPKFIIKEYINNYLSNSFKNNFDNFSTDLLNYLLKNIKDL